MVIEKIQVVHCDAEKCKLPPKNHKKGVKTETIEVVHDPKYSNEEKQIHDHIQNTARTLDDIMHTDPADKKSWGPKAWQSLHAVCTTIPCQTCREHCHRMIDFEHDVVNRNLKKPLHDEDHYYSYMGMLAGMEE